MSKNVQTDKQTETQGALTTPPVLDPSCGNGSNITMLLAKPQAISAWLKVVVTAYCLVLISLFLMGKLPGAAVTTAVWLVGKYVSKCL